MFVNLLPIMYCEGEGVDLWRYAPLLMMMMMMMNIQNDSPTGKFATALRSNTLDDVD